MAHYSESDDFEDKVDNSNILDLGWRNFFWRAKKELVDETENSDQ